MRQRDQAVAQNLRKRLKSFERLKQSLPGLRSTARREVLIEQLVESIRRIKYIAAICSRDVCPSRADPHSDQFDPLKAALLHKRAGDIDEASWLVFLSVHFGKHNRTGWRLSREVYGRLGDSKIWDWPRTSGSPVRFRRWLATNEARLIWPFSNHRKYQSLDAWNASGTGAAVDSYVSWIMRFGNHRLLIQDAERATNGTAEDVFDYLYRSMSAVVSFGRLAKFDFLTMLGKLELAEIEPGSAYLQKSSGPIAGARLLLQGHTNRLTSTSELDDCLVDLGSHLGVGMQVIEDALCNWQKSPDRFRSFRG